MPMHCLMNSDINIYQCYPMITKASHLPLDEAPPFQSTPTLCGLVSILTFSSNSKSSFEISSIFAL